MNNVETCETPLEQPASAYPDGCAARAEAASNATSARGGRASRGVAGTLVVVMAVSSPSLAAFAAERAPAQDGAIACSQPQAELPASTAAFGKTEVVYVNLDESGDARSASVVNMFDVQSPGTIVDFGPYGAVVSLSEDKALVREGAATAFEAQEGRFIYQGDIADPVIPWNISLAYELDGRPVSAEDVAGATGDVAVHLKTSRNEAADAAFYDSYMLQATFTLPAGACSDVVADRATLAMAGEDRTVAFTVLPGNDGDFTITMKAKDFRLPSAQIVALPYSSVIEMPSAEGMVDGVSQLAGAISQLASGAQQLKEGVSSFSSGVDEFASGSESFGAGLDALAGSSDQLVSASSQIDGAFSLMGDIISGIDLAQLDRLAELLRLMRQLADALDAVADGASDVSDNYAAAYAAISKSVGAIPDATVSDAQIEELRRLADTTEDPSDDETVESLASAYHAAQAVKQTFAEHEGSLDAAARNLEATAKLSSDMSETARALRALADEFDASIAAGGIDDLKGILSGIGEMTQRYGMFHQGLVDYTDGVKALASNYAQMNAGAHGLAAGAGKLAQGATGLAGGVSQLNAVTVDLPQTMRDQIAAMMADYDFPAFEPRSFASPDNAFTSEVQFVISTPAIEKSDVQVEPEPGPEPGFWDRLLALFS